MKAYLQRHCIVPDSFSWTPEDFKQAKKCLQESLRMELRAEAHQDRDPGEIEALPAHVLVLGQIFRCWRDAALPSKRWRRRFDSAGVCCRRFKSPAQKKERFDMF